MLYAPPHFAVDERELAAELIRANPLATLVSAGAAEPVVSHVPLLLVDEAEPWRLLGHVARANPHWEILRAQPSALAVFHGGDAYISPALYSTRKAVPTWNYAVVHVQGSVSLNHDSATKERVLKALIDQHDPPYRSQWDELDETYREGMKAGIVAFTITVERVDAKFKLSQNRPPDDFARALEAMESGSDKGLMLAHWMRRVRNRKA
jgi:transcriptional regulator